MIEKGWAHGSAPKQSTYAEPGMSGRHFNRALDCIRLAWLFGQGNVATAEYVNGRSESGRGGGIRTPDPLLPKQMRYQAALRPDFSDYPTPAIRSADDLSTHPISHRALVRSTIVESLMNLAKMSDV